MSFAEWNGVLDDEEGRTDSRDAEFKYGFPLLDLAFSLLIATIEVSRTRLEKRGNGVCFSLFNYSHSQREGFALLIRSPIPGQRKREGERNAAKSESAFCTLLTTLHTPHWRHVQGKPTTAISISFDNAAESTGTDHLAL